jgi:rhodanese-related sulfurtransferase
MQEISPQNAFDQIANGQAIGIDVRETNEWNAGRATGVISNPLSAFDFKVIPNDRPVIFICRSGARSTQVASAIALNKRDVFNLTGGMKAWQAAGLPMVSENGNPEVA